MITLNGKKFASNDKEFVESLFHSGGTCVGYYKTTKRTVFLLDMQRNKIGFVNRHGVLGTCAYSESEKRWLYYPWAPRLIGEYPRYLQECEEAQAIADRFLKQPKEVVS